VLPKRSRCFFGVPISPLVGGGFVSPLGAAALRATRKLFDERERLLKLLLAPFELCELVALGAQNTQELLDLHLLRERPRAEAGRCRSRAEGPRAPQ
jgi:hypothetical protein